jgi:outer membrane receptor protein involved in Fe transport
VTAQLGYKPRETWRLKLDLFNVFDTRASDVDYFYASRLPGEPRDGIGDVHTHPGEPRSLRLGLTATF